MDYQPPSGSTSPDAPYIGKNVAAGIQGSRVPRSAVEHPMRELVALIREGLPEGPSAGDLRQVLKAIRGGRLTTFQDLGSVNALAIAATTPHLTLFRGLPFRIFPAATNTQAAVTLTVNGTLQGVVVRTDGSPLAEGDIETGSPFDIVHDGSRFRLMGPGRIENVRLPRSSPWYVDVAGDDANDGLTPATALRTIATAYYRARLTFAFAEPVTIQLVSPGTYPFPAAQPRIPGALVIRGNPAAQGSYIVSGAGPSGGGGSVIGSGGFDVSLIGLTVRNLSTNNHTVSAATGGSITLQFVTLTSAAPLVGASHVFVGGSASGTISTGVRWATSADAMMTASGGRIAITTNASLFVDGGPTWGTAAANALDGGWITVRGGVSITGAASGPRYRVLSSASGIRAGGQGENFFPGISDGSKIDGGLYYG